MACTTASRTRIVAFEGLNCAGKSTLARATAEVLQCERVQVPPLGARASRALFEDSFSDAAMLFYFSWVKHLDEMVERGSFGPILICDRYVASTLSYFSAAGNPADNLVKAFPVAQPALTVLVTVDEAVRRQRIFERSDIRQIDKKTLLEDFRAQVLASVRTFEPIIEVDTTSRDVDSCALETAELIKDRLLHQVS
jgi:thymidylate kinase